MSAATCAVCGGPIAPSHYPRKGKPAPNEWIHLDREDWIDNVHQAVPTSAVTP